MSTPGVGNRIGELAGTDIRFWEGRQGRERVRILEYATGRLSFSEAFNGWGAHVIGVVAGDKAVRNYARKTYPAAKAWTPRQFLARAGSKTWKCVFSGGVTTVDDWMSKSGPKDL